MKWSIKLKDEIKDLAFSTYVSIFYNLNDLADKAQAIKNLGLFDKLASIEEIKRLKYLRRQLKQIISIVLYLKLIKINIIIR